MRQAAPEHRQGRFTATVPDIPAYGEGDSEAEAIEDLKEALRLYIDVRGVDAVLPRVRPTEYDHELDLADIIGGDAQ